MQQENQLFEYTAEPEDEGARIDKLLSGLLEGRSRSFIQKLIEGGCVLVEKKSVKASYKVREEDRIEVSLPAAQPLEVKAQDIPLTVLYEDDDLLVIDKPKKMVVHPAPGHMEGTVVNAVLWHCKGNLSGINGVLRPGIVHRIDKDTTGSLVICKNDRAHRALAEQLSVHAIDRTYRALVWGRIEVGEGVVDAPIGRDSRDRKKMAVTEGGKRAVTHYRVLERFEKLTYIECRLETGRTHQIRVHMAHMGHPVLGDEVYGRFKAPAAAFAGDSERTDEKTLAKQEQERRARIRKELTQAGITKIPEGFCGQCLHAMQLSFEHPVTGERVETRAPLPEYFAELLSELGSVSL